ncbi:protein DETOXIFICATION 33-like [Magnolia sinica]|uniref:protein DETOXIFICATION 33-like n=1 Tax=Magnolia sinica TaxID=86752 RepID=UPI002658173D|nr:protein DETOXIFICATION 33-like [Magnolia sinica]
MAGDDMEKGGLEPLKMQKLGYRSWEESKKMWSIAGPAILTSVLQFSIGFVTAAFVGRLGHVQLAAVSVVQTVVESFAYGILLGMGSALETLCGQAVGAGQMHMLGIYLQRSWIITGVTALVLTPIYVFTSHILKLFRQSNEISEVAGRYCIWVIPQLFAYALNFPMQKFFQSQSRVWVMAIISGAVLAFHILLNWALVTKLGYGLGGAALAGNISWWLVNLAQLVYLVAGYFPDAWTGFSLSVFQSLSAFIKLSLASAAMLCLELWYFSAVILLVGGLKNHTAIAIDAVSICMNLEVWALTIALGFNVAVSVRVSNELGAGHPKAAKFSVAVTAAASALVGVLFMAAVLIAKSDFPKLFTEKPEVIRETSKLGLLLAATILLNSIQPVLQGVAVGAGWQFSVAFVNIGCYYFIGLPLGGLLGFKFKLGVVGIWSGMLAGTLMQTVVLLWIMYRTNWEKEALQAEERIKTWGGPSESQEAS